MNPTDKIPLTLEVQQWQIVVNLLAEGPYKLSAPLIASLQEQFNAAQSHSQPAVPDEVAAVATNGSGTSHAAPRRPRVTDA